MREPGFWWREPGLAGALLAPLGALYGAVAGARMAREGTHAAAPVICVGNLTLGGSGKTPTAIAIAQLLMKLGERPFLLTRGYGGTQSGPLHVDLKRHHARDVGDEALLLARVAPTIVAHDRVLGAKIAHASGATVIVMDDGLQNPSLHKTFSLAVIDGRRGLGNARVFPAGPLRAPLDQQIARIHALLVIGEGAKDTAAAFTRGRRLPIFRARLEPETAKVESLRGQQILAFAGIGDPEKFFATLAAAGIDAQHRRGFSDHHRYSAAEAQSLLVQAEQEQLRLLTTEKDHARMAGDPALAARAQTLPVALRLDDEAGFARLIRERIGK